MNASVKTAFGINNGYAPAEGPKVLPLSLDFSTLATITNNFFQEHAEGIIQFFQTIWIDNSDNLNDFTVTTNTGQVIRCSAGGQGAFPLIHQLPGELKFATTPAANLVVKVQLLNVPLASYQVGPITANVSATVDPLVPSSNVVNWSNTIALGGTSQPGIPANVLRKSWFIQNPPDAIELLYIEFGVGAAVGTSLALAPGEVYPPNGANVVWNGLINVMAATTGHVFIAKEFFT